jgi:hypothetical protein
LKADRTIKISNEGQIAIKIRTMFLDVFGKIRNSNTKCDAITGVNDAIPIYFDAIIFMVPIML